MEFTSYEDPSGSGYAEYLEARNVINDPTATKEALQDALNKCNNCINNMKSDNPERSQVIADRDTAQAKLKALG